MLCGVTDLVAKLLSAAAAARTIKAFWQSAAHTFSERWGGARVRLSYAGLREAGTVLAGHGTTGPPRESEWVDPQGRRVQLAVETDPDLPLPGLAEIACRLGAMVALRLGLERDRRLGTFLMELSRWLLAAPERDLMLRYTMQSVMNLVEAQGAYVALREPAGGAGEGSTLRVVTAIGTGVEMHGLELPLEASVTGRVVRTGQPVNTENILAEPDSYTPADLSRTARAAMIVPLNTSSGVAGAAGVIRYMQLGAQEPPPPFGLVELHYFTAVAAHIAGGLELTQAVTATREAATRAAAMVNGSPLPLALVNSVGRVQQLNEAGRRVFGLSEVGEALGHTIEALGLSSSGTSFADVLAAAARAAPWHGRVVIVQPSGDRRICDCTTTVLSGLGSDDVLVALYDRTDELRAQRELIAREKLATVGEIASGVAHEVNNPLAAIRMEAELLKRATRDPDTDAAASTIVREVDRAARIVRSLLRLARRGDTDPVRVQLNELVRDVAEIRQRVLRSDNVELRTELDMAAPPILGLGQELQQVVINLVTNAEHAVRAAGPGMIQLTTKAREGWVRFTVEDSGPGVAPEIRNRIFDPFFTTKGPDEGTGLGLSICQRVVAEVGGRIWLEDSEALGGAKFVVELPAAPERVESTTIG